jgi:hypothetical protein
MPTRARQHSPGTSAPERRAENSRIERGRACYIMTRIYSYAAPVARSQCFNIICCGRKLPMTLPLILPSF